MDRFRGMPWRLARTSGVAILAATTCATCSHTAAPTSAPQALSVSVSDARLATLRDTITAAGTVVPIPAADFTVFAPQPARIAALPVTDGETVKAGDLLVTFDVEAFNDEVTARQGEVSLASVRLSGAKAEAERTADLYGRGIIARNQRDAAQHAVEVAQTALAEAQAELDAARRQQASATVKARFAGTVAKCWHHEGDFVATIDDPVLRLVDPTRVQVVVTLSMAELARVVPGQPATITAGGAGPGVPATVRLRPMPTDPKAKTAQVRLSFTNATTLPLDTPVEVEIVLSQRSNVVAIPRAAVLRDEQGAYVFLAGDDGRAHRTAVRLGLLTRDQAEVISGVSAGDHLITTDLDSLVDGMAVSVQ